MVERNMCDAVMRGIVVPPGSRATSRAQGARRNLGYLVSDRHLLTRRSASGRRGVVADDARTREVALRRSSCEADEQGGAIRCGAGGAKGGDRGECGPAKHAPGAVPGTRGTGAGLHTARLAVDTRGGNRMRESCTYGSVRGAPSNGRPYRDRRNFITLLGGAAAAWPLVGRAQQQPAITRLVGLLLSQSEGSQEARDRVTAVREGLEKLGWIEGITCGSRRGTRTGVQTAWERKPRNSCS